MVYRQVNVTDRGWDGLFVPYPSYSINYCHHKYTPPLPYTKFPACSHIGKVRDQDSGESVLMLHMTSSVSYSTGEIIHSEAEFVSCLVGSCPRTENMKPCRKTDTAQSAERSSVSNSLAFKLKASVVFKFQVDLVYGSIYFTHSFFEISNLAQPFRRVQVEDWTCVTCALCPSWWCGVVS